MNASGISSGKKYRGFADDSTADWKTWNDMVLSKGGDEFHNNMQPYMVTNMYKRIY
jgi:microcystin-dependent protein